MLEDVYFLHFNLGFWLIAFPIIVMGGYIKYCLWINEKRKNEELTGRLPNKKIFINLTEEEKFMLDAITRRSGLGSTDKFLRYAIEQVVKEVLEE